MRKTGAAGIDGAKLNGVAFGLAPPIGGLLVFLSYMHHEDQSDTLLDA